MTARSSVYRELFRAPGAVGFTAAGLVARLTTSMIGLGLVLAVTAAHARYAEASEAVAVLLAANTVANPITGRLADRHGQDRVLIPQALAFGAAMALLIALLAGHASAWLLFPASALAGASMPVVGPMIRSRWTELFIADEGRRRTAYAFESVLTELVYLIGPILVTLLATSLTALAGLGAVLGCAFFGTIALALQRGSQPKPVPGAQGSRFSLGALKSPALALICLSNIGIGGIYGSVELVTVGFATAHGHRGLTGILLALWGAGAMVSGLRYGAVAGPRGTPRRRAAVASLGMLVGVAALCLGPNLGVLAALLLLAGILMAPAVIATMEVLQQEVPVSVLTEATGWTLSSMALGMAAGSVAAGSALGRLGAAHGYVVPAAFGLLSVCAVQLLVRAGGAVQPGIADGLADGRPSVTEPH